MSKIIVSFCCECGSCLRPQVILCDNCAQPVQFKECRLEGEFSHENARRLGDLHRWDLVPRNGTQ